MTGSSASFLTRVDDKTQGGGSTSFETVVKYSRAAANTSLVSVTPEYALDFVDVNVKVQNASDNPDGLEHDQSTFSGDLVQKVLPTPLEPGSTWAGRILVARSKRSGYVARGKCFQERFVQCSDLGKFYDRTTFGQHVRAVKGNDWQELLEDSLFVFVRSRDVDHLVDEETLLSEVQARIDFTWLSETQPECKTLAVIDGHLNPESYTPFREAAREFGIKYVVFDRPGHWISEPSYSHLHDGFFPLDMNPDEAFYARIVDAVRAYGHVDGIVAIASYCLPPVAKAASILGLPTMPAEAVALSVNKYETRVLDGDAGPVALVEDVSDLQTRLAEGKIIPQYPMIVKPIIGTGSAHVYRADTEGEMIAATRQASTSGKKIIVEAYIDGPELDVNFVLLDGEILFFDMNDDFPSPGDSETSNGDFWETTTVQPSILPPEEYEVVRTSLHQLLLKIGLTTGVYHLEARVQNSSMSFQEEDGLIDLRPHQSPSPGRKPRSFLMEVNPRPPGMPEILSTVAAYGVNMYSLHVLAALGDYERLRSFAKPFAPKPGMPNNSRAWSQLVFLRADKGGVCTSEDACADVVKLLAPEEQALIEAAVCFYHRGQRVPEPKPGVVQSGAFFMLASRTSRHDMMQVAQKLRKNFAIPVVAA